MQSRIASQQFRPTVYRNMHLFGGCSTQFMERLMMMLHEVSLMPGESVLKAGEISRKLSFVRQGSLMVTDARGTLIELIIGEVRWCYDVAIKVMVLIKRVDADTSKRISKRISSAGTDITDTGSSNSVSALKLSCVCREPHPAL